MARRKSRKHSEINGKISKKWKPQAEGKASLWNRYSQLLVIIFIPWLLYAGTLEAGFIWDDHNLIEMTAAKGNSGSDFLLLWVSDFWGTDQGVNKSEYYRPLTTSTFMLDSKMHDKSPRGYHRTNVLIYSILCGLAYLIYAKLFQSRRLAFLIGLAFMALPAHTENVAWVSGRTDLTCTALMFGAMLSYLHWEEKNRVLHAVLSVGLFFLSLFGKEMSITFVAIVGLHQSLSHGIGKRTIMRTLPFAVAAIVFWIIHSLAAPFIHTENVFTTPYAYIMNIVRNMALGVWHSILPGGFHYIVTATREQAEQTFPIPGILHLLLMALLVTICSACAIYAAIKKEKLAALAMGSGLITLLPVSGIIPIGVIFAVRFLLIPSFFFLLFIGLVIEKFPGRKPS